MIRSGARLVPYLAVGLGLFWFQNAWAALLSYHLGMLLFLRLGRAFGHFRSLGPILRPGWAALAWTSACFAGILLYLGWNNLHLPPDLPISLARLGLTPQTWPPFIAYFAIVNPWFEETYWRSWLSPPSKIPVPDDFWFAGFHSLIIWPYVSFGWLLLAIIILAGAAWLWRQIFRQTGSLFIPAIAHLLADFSVLTSIYLRTTYP